MTRFPKAKPTAGQKLPRRPRDWRNRTHVCISAGQADWDGQPLCAECGFRRDHAIHDLNQDIVVAGAELDARRIGERAAEARRMGGDG